jgi:putative ABC transport system ATP-binding protein
VIESDKRNSHFSIAVHEFEMNKFDKLLKNLSLIDNVMFPALVSKDADKNAVYQKAKKLMEMTGIEKFADNTITQGSGGQLQRVAISR